jgi:hypothetical protein
MKIFRAVVGVLLAISISTSTSTPVFADAKPASRTSTPLSTKAQQIVALEVFLAELDSQYGQPDAKEKDFGLNIEGLRQKYTKLINEAKTLEEFAGYWPLKEREILPPEEFRQLMIGMLAEYRDGHANTNRLSHNAWGVGIIPTMIEGRLYVAGVNPDLMQTGTSEEQIQIGDEVVAVNGVDVQKLAQERLLYVQRATYETRLNEAMGSILRFSESMFRGVKEGEPVEILFNRDGRTFKAHLNWLNLNKFSIDRQRFPGHFQSSQVMNAFEEEVPMPYGTMAAVSSYFRQGIKQLHPKPGELIDIGELLNQEIKKSNGKLHPEDPSSPPVEPISRLQAYIVRARNVNVGVLRIPSYNPANMVNELRWLAEAIERLENSTDVLVLDVTANAGGAGLLLSSSVHARG